MNQKTKVYEYMRSHGSITRRDAAFLGVMELSSRIIELERMGIDISRERIEVTDREGNKIKVMKYWLTEVAQ